MEIYQPTIPMIRRVKLVWMNFRMWPGFKWIVRALVSLVIISILGWGGYMMTPGKRSERLIAHAQEKIAEKSWDEAAVAMRKAANIYSHDRPTRWMLANTLFGAGKTQEGIAEMENALMLPPFEEDTYKQLFQTYYNIMRTSSDTKPILAQITKLEKILPPAQQWMPTMLIARAHFIDSEFDKSISLFSQILIDKPENRRIKIDLAQSLFAAEKVREAQSIYQKILESSPDDAEANHGLATTLASMGKTNEALRAYIRASLVSTNPRLGNLINGGLFAINLGQLRDAKIHFIDQLVSHFPDTRESILLQMQYDVLANEETHFFQLLRDKMPEINEVDFTGLVSWCIDRGQPLWGLKLLKEYTPPDMDAENIQTLKASALIEMHRFGAARKVIAKISDKGQQRLLITAIDLETGKTEKAEKEFEKLISLKGEGNLEVSRAARERLGKLKGVEERLTQFDILPRSRILLAQGKANEVLRLQKGKKTLNIETQVAGILALLQLGQEKKAIKQLESLTGQYPDNESIWILWGRLFSNSKPEATLKGLKKAIASGADGPGVRSLLGEVQYKLGQHKAAISTWKEVSLRWPGTLMGNINNVFLAQAYMVQKNWPSAVKVWEKVLKIAPDDILTLNNLAYCLLKTNKDLERAKKLTEQALLVEPERPEIIDTLEQINKAISSQARKAPKPKGSAKVSAP